ncbi:MAG: gamma-glutamyltransferase [Pseudomonadota bacterium]
MPGTDQPKNGRVAVASSSSVATDAATRVIREGGNAVDAAIAAAFVSVNTEPGVCALAGGAYITIWEPGQNPLCIDGYARVPGLGADDAARNSGDAVHMKYGGGVTTVIGAASVAVPGTPAALAELHRRYGALPWSACLEPAIELCRGGFPLPSACHHYLKFSGRKIFGRSVAGFRALHPDCEQLADAGDLIVVPGLADSLALIAKEGVDAFYKGDIGRALISHVQAGGGNITRQDLESFEPEIRPALKHNSDGWTLALPPPPSIGGCMLAALLTLTAAGTDPVDAMRRGLAYRRQHIDFATDLPATTRALLDAAQHQQLPHYRSANTVHTSAADSHGLACAITASAGYGCGEIPEGTGLWLNNCLGEIELNRRGLDAGPAGATLPTNMAPAVARRADAVLAIGSPGADRITSAMLQTLMPFLSGQLDIEAAIAAPRWHVEMALEADAKDDKHRSILHAEPGANFNANHLEVREHDTKNMFFGGVGAAGTVGEAGELIAVADPRRIGGVTVEDRGR